MILPYCPLERCNAAQPIRRTSYLRSYSATHPETIFELTAASDPYRHSRVRPSSCFSHSSSPNSKARVPPQCERYHPCRVPAVSFARPPLGPMPAIASAAAARKRQSLLSQKLNESGQSIFAFLLCQLADGCGTDLPLRFLLKKSPPIDPRRGSMSSGCSHGRSRVVEKFARRVPAATRRLVFRPGPRARANPRA